ncbi:hypothetical protein WOLCODRAFT_158716 [Wolfiporia cocos MD-104 SS10]|uniref:Uncharacterized protein n=1 Tax=Wolfiporia cocos (strain MD-104) TaxID=742152 RepID=A0A2H3JN61_WOLCO|nr:hypothetical protein WOLCODRAFT_158716 [Wolfiporia cocos MD-104 SS10]
MAEVTFQPAGQSAGRGAAAAARELERPKTIEAGHRPCGPSGPLGTPVPGRAWHPVHGPGAPFLQI